MAQCTAKSKRSGERCKRQAVKGSSVCYMHGGRTPKGVASPHFKHGRYSKYMPAQLSERYLEALNDPDLMALRDSCALIDARLIELLGKVNSAPGAGLWPQARETFEKLKVALYEKDADALRASVIKLDDIMSKGNEDKDVWEEIYSVVDQRRRLVETERRYLITAQQVVTVTEFMTMIGSISALARACFGMYENELRKFIDGIVALTAVETGPALPGGFVDGSTALLADDVQERGDR